MCSVEFGLGILPGSDDGNLIAPPLVPTPDCGAIDNWWFLGEEESIFV